MSHLPPDPYKILGVHKDAQISEVRSAYKKLVLKCHPDKVQDPKLKLEKQDEFQRVQQAYELLSNDREREKYNNQVRLADLRKQFQSQAASQYYAPEPARPRGRSSPPPFSRNYYRASWDDDVGPSPRVPPDARAARKEASYVERPSKRAVEREREKEKDREHKERERRRNERRAAEHEAKEQQKAERKQKERLRDKNAKRESEDKKRYTKSMFTDSPDEEPTKSKSDRKKAMAEKHIKEARSRDSPSLPRQSSHASRHPWPVPSPPPMPSQPPQFAAADDNLHRPAGRQRRGSEGSQWAASWARHKPRDDTPDFPPGLGTPKQNKFAKSASTASPGMAEPGARREGQRHGMGPIDAFPRAMPGSRSPPFSPMAGYGEDQPRGRQRSRMQSQIREEESNDVYAERRARDRDYERFPERDRERDYDVKHHRTRSSRLPDDGRGERYPDGSGRIKFETFTTSRRGEPLAETKTYYSRPPMTGRGSSFNPANVRHSKLYSQSDVLYGDYPATGIYA